MKCKNLGPTHLMIISVTLTIIDLCHNYKHCSYNYQTIIIMIVTVVITSIGVITSMIIIVNFLVIASLNLRQLLVIMVNALFLVYYTGGNKLLSRHMASCEQTLKCLERGPKCILVLSLATVGKMFISLQCLLCLSHSMTIRNIISKGTPP